jgi:hypothetical protein
MEDVEEPDILLKFLNRVEVVNQDIYLLTTYLKKLSFSGMYGKEYYDKLVEITKGSEFEKEVVQMGSAIKNIETESLETILDVESNVFDGIRAEIIMNRINKIQVVSLKIKFIDQLHKKFLYMLGNDEIEEREKIYIAQLFLRCYYNRDKKF